MSVDEKGFEGKKFAVHRSLKKSCQAESTRCTIDEDPRSTKMISLPFHEHEHHLFVVFLS